MMKVCRACLGELTVENTYVHLYGDDRSSQIVKELSLCLPELTLSLVKDPVICITCLSMLHLAYNFKQKCLTNEAAIKNMIEQIMPSKEFTLGEIVQINNHQIMDNPAEDTEDIVDTKISLLDILKEIDPEMVIEIEKQECIFVGEISAVDEADERDQPERMSECEQPPVSDVTAEDGDMTPVIMLTRLPQYVESLGTVLLDKDTPVDPSVTPQNCLIEAKAVPPKTIKKGRRDSTQKRFQCKSCEYSSNDRTNLRRHMVIHTKRPMLKCPYCQFETLSGQYFRTHKNAHIAKKPKQPKKTKGKKRHFACDKCAFATTTRKLLNKHMQVHSDQLVKPYLECATCKYKTKSRALFSSHSETCGKPKQRHGESVEILSCNPPELTAKGKATPFGCIVCDYTTPFRANLVKHMRRHNNSGKRKIAGALTKYNFVHSESSELVDGA